MSSGSDFDEEAAIGNFWTDTIYPRNFKDGSGKYLNIVTEDDGATTVEYHPPFPTRNRVKLTVKFIRANGDIKEVTLKRFKQYTTRGITRWEEQHWGPEDPMTFSYFTFEKILGFLKLLTELDLVNLDARRVALRDGAGDGMDEETRAKMVALLSREDGLTLVDEMLRNGSITSRDLVNIGYRKEQLAIFERLLRTPGALAAYREANSLASTITTEKVWQHFFARNQWIFGYGLDYRFLGILQREAHVGDEDVAGKEGAITDFLLHSTNFTVLVEMKAPGIPLFEERRNRAGAWKLSHEFQDAMSQILEQKAAWQVKGAHSAGTDEDGNFHHQRAADPKSILLIGTDDDFKGTDKVRQMKLRTFELFRRDSRNIEILTYDELLERARFIVSHEPSRPEETAQDIPPFPDEPSYGGPPPRFQADDVPTFDAPAFGSGSMDDDIPF